MSALIVDGSGKETNTRAELLEIKGVIPNAPWYTMHLWRRSMQESSSCVSVNARCSLVAGRCHQIGVHAVADMTTPKPRV